MPFLSPQTPLPFPLLSYKIPNVAFRYWISLDEKKSKTHKSKTTTTTTKTCLLELVLPKASHC